MPAQSKTTTSSIVRLLSGALLLGCFAIAEAQQQQQLRMTPRRGLDGSNAVLSLDETRAFLADLSQPFDLVPHFYMSTANLVLKSQNPIPSDATEEDLIAFLQEASQEEADKSGERGGDRRILSSSHRFLKKPPSNTRGGNGGAGSTSRSCNNNNGRQTVFLDFDIDETFLAGIFFESTGQRLTLTFESYQLSEEEQTTILQRLRADYEGFKVDFVIEEPMDCDFSTISFNTPSDVNVFFGLTGVAIGFVIPTSGEVRIATLFGRADGVDLFNKNMADGAVALGNTWTAIVQVFDIVQAFGRNGAAALEFYSGIAIDDETTIEDALSIATVNQVSNTAARELGQILGLRAYDSIGAPGDDIPDFISTNINGGIVDLFVTDQSDSETLLHIMASPSLGLSFRQIATTDSFFSERSAIKILLGTNGEGLTYGEDEAKRRGGDIGSNKPGMRLKQLTVPNTIIQGAFAGKNLAASTLVVEGNIDTVGEAGTDYFRFSFEEGQFITANAISWADSNVADRVITGLTLFQEDRLTGDLTPLVTHFQDFETFDPLIFDFEIPESGNYVLSVYAQEFVCLNRGQTCFDLEPAGAGEFNTGDYTLLVYSVDRALGPA